MSKHSAKNHIPLFGRKRLITDLTARNDELTRLLDEYGLADVTKRQELITDLDERITERDRILEERKRLADKQEEGYRLRGERLKADLDRQEAEKRREIDELEKRLVPLRDQAALDEVGMFDYDNPARDSVKLKDALVKNKAAQKDAIRAATAIHTTRAFTFNNSAKEGRRFLNDMSKMALSLFNAEAEAAVKSVKSGSLGTAMKRLDACCKRIERFGRFIDLTVDPSYLRLRKKELSLTAEYLRAKETEKELERERKAELREQQRVRKELEARMAKLRKEREHYANALAAVEGRADTEEAERLRTKLADLDRSIEDVDHRSANERAGYVYVISNIGAFGPDVVKIGMTRRLEPMDRVRELSGASVPFKFDVHALFFSEDAVGLETRLHHAFESVRVNKVNARKEFFRCTPQQVLDRLREENVAVVEFKVEPDAEEYRLSLEAAHSPSAPARSIESSTADGATSTSGVPSAPDSEPLRNTAE